MRSSQYSDIGMREVYKWRNELDSDQSVDLHDSESPLDSTRSLTNSSLENLVNPDDSASNVSEVTTDAGLGDGFDYDVNDFKGVLHDINDVEIYQQYLNDPAWTLDISTSNYFFTNGDLILNINPDLFNLFI